MENQIAQKPDWSLYKKIALRFAFIFFALYIVLYDWYSNFFSIMIYYYGQLEKPLASVVFWVGYNIFQIPYVITTPSPGSHADYTYVYLLYFIFAVVAVVGTIVWSLLDRKRTNLDKLYYWFTVMLRYYVAIVMFIFALEKFFKTQFGDLGFHRLTQPLGDMSPMSLAWAFFGYSQPYNVFMGIAEATALLLLFRRTMNLGAVLTLAALANVIVINLAYDIHAKFYPVGFFVMTLILLLPNIEKLIKFFLTDQVTPLRVIQAPVFKKRWMNISKTVFKYLVIAFHCGFLGIWSYFYYGGYINERNQAKAEFVGIYDVETFVVNEDTLSNESPLRWREIALGDIAERVRLKGDSIAFIDLSVAKKEMLLYGNGLELRRREQEIHNELGYEINTDSILVARNIKSKFHFEKTDPTTMVLKGKVENDSVFVRAKRRSIEIKDFRLMRRKPQLVTEAEYFY
ncbi:MAG: hypothetical protein KF845_05335 [Cyclobacteriaceae bacterium]|nr:hypothetical protein [Cyclobacteriaceae bacterium]